MEGSDAFGTPVSEGEDPFAGGEDWAGFGGEPTEESGTEEIKTVDKEGQEVKPEDAPVGTSSDTRSELERKEDAYQYKSERGEPVSEELRDAHLEFERQQVQATEDEEFEAAAPEPEAATPADDAARAAEVAPDPNDQLRAISEREAAEKAAEANEEQAATDAQEAAGAAERAVEDVQAAEAERETAEGAQESPEQVAAPSEVRISDQTPEEPQTPGGEIGTEEASPEADEAEEATAPQERQSPGGKTTHRRYYVLQNMGPGEFKQVSWYENAEGKMVPKGTTGAKRQAVALCRGTEDALRIGHAALGSPDRPVKLVAVAALHFQPRTLEPDVPEPRRTRLKIS